MKSQVDSSSDGRRPSAKFLRWEKTWHILGSEKASVARAGVGNIWPAGHIRPMKSFDLVRTRHLGVS